MVSLSSVLLSFMPEPLDSKGSSLKGNGDFLGESLFQLDNFEGGPLGEWSLVLPRRQEKGTP